MMMLSNYWRFFQVCCAFFVSAFRVVAISSESNNIRDNATMFSATSNVTNTINTTDRNRNHNLNYHRTGEWTYEYRKKVYLEACAGRSTFYPTQACRAYLNESSVGPNHVRHGHNYSWPHRMQQELEKVYNKEDTADFVLNSVLRMLYLDRRHPTLPHDMREDFVSAVLDFKYWYDEPGEDTMCYWSENHQILFATAELLAGQLFPDAIFANSNMTGKEHITKAIPRIQTWLDYRFRFGFSEWHSNRYFDEDIPALMNLIDFANSGDTTDGDGDEANMIASRATIVMDLIVFDMACNYYKGSFLTAHGRTYQGTMGIDSAKGIHDTIKHAAWILLGLGDPLGYPGQYSATFVTTSDRYKVPAILQKIADASLDGIVHRQRDGINIEDGPLYGIGYGTRDTDEVLFWWGMEAYFAPEVIQGSFLLLNRLSQWKDNFWYLRELLWPVGYHPPILAMGASVVKDLSLGLALESASTYTYRTPHYQLSGVQDYKPGYFSGQAVTWMAGLDSTAYVLTTSPAFSSDNLFHAGAKWTGGFLPRVTMHENVAVIQYKRPHSNIFTPILDRLLFAEYSHAYFPAPHFDEVVETGHWVIGRKDLGYVALWSQSKTYWSDFEHSSDAQGRELIADSKENVWIVELGDSKSNGDFQDFVASIEAANITISNNDNRNEIVKYNSPSQGMVTVGWEGPLKVAGKDIDLGPYMRWDNEYAQQEFNTRHLVISHGDEHLELDFENGRRIQSIDPNN